MSIEVGGKVFRTLADELYIPGEGKVVGAYLGTGEKVYPSSDLMFGNLAIYKKDLETKIYGTSAYGDFDYRFNYEWADDVISHLSVIVEIDYDSRFFSHSSYNLFGRQNSLWASDNEIAAKVRCRLTHSLIGEKPINVNVTSDLGDHFSRKHAIVKDEVYDALNFTIDFSYYLITNKSSELLIYINDDYQKYRSYYYDICINRTLEGINNIYLRNNRTERLLFKRKTVTLECSDSTFDIIPEFDIYYPFEYILDDGSEFYYDEELMSYTKGGDLYWKDTSPASRLHVTGFLSSTYDSVEFLSA